MPVGLNGTGPHKDSDMPKPKVDCDFSESDVLTAIVDRQPAPPERLVGERLAEGAATMFGDDCCCCGRIRQSRTREAICRLICWSLTSEGLPAVIADL